MADVRHLAIVTQRISKQFPLGQVEDAHYILDGRTVILTDRDGKPLYRDGQKYMQELGPTDKDAAAIATQMTRQRLTVTRSYGARPRGFGGDIPYK
jgi:hypothetical protein